MDGNYARIVGEAKRDAVATNVREGLRVINFTLVVPNVGGRMTYVDCTAYGSELVDGQLEGFVNEGETFEVEGCLDFRSVTRQDGTMHSGLFVYVESVQAL